jgi:NlpC/P60 family putative phage cell wall peptidase
MTLRERIVAEALTWEGTPYHHHAALKGIGCDCIGLIRGVARDVGLLSRDFTPDYYSPEWHLHNHEELMLWRMEALGCVRKDPEMALPGDCLLFQYGKACSHAGFLVSSAPLRLIHSSIMDKRVIQQTLTRDLCNRWRHAYVLPEVPR